MTRKTVAEQISDLHQLKESGALSEEEFSQAKTRLLNSIGTSDGVTETFTTAAGSVTSAFSNALGNSETSFRNLAWILYWGTAAATLIGLFPVFAWVTFFVGIAIVIIAALKMAPAAGTIYNSHFRNILVVTIISVVGYYLLLLVTLGTFGLGLIITIPLGLALIVWYIYRVVKGMLRLNEGNAI